MGNLFQFLFGGSGSAKPFRRDAQIGITYDSDGNPLIEGVEAESVTLSPEGSLDRIKILTDRFYHCGCSRATQVLGGQCGDHGCNRLSCVNCFGHCADCSKPLCLEHSLYSFDDQGKRVRFCKSCHDAVLRKRTLAKIGRTLLSPFVDFGKRS